ncbi:MAG: hypothetical protein QOH75_473 [Actinomycetota bacterium]|nr:hypothetical protein [Actinomycetota bacterium]
MLVVESGHGGSCEPAGEGDDGRCGLGRVSAVAGAARDLLGDVLGLALPATCAGCDGPAPVLCATCRGLLTRGARPAWPDPVPDGLPPPWAVATYSGAVRDIVIAHKEHGRRALAEPLGAALASSVAAALGGIPPSRAAVLVPMPSRAAAVRARGHDPTLAMTRQAAAKLRRDGRRVSVLPVLRLARSVRDQAGLDAAARSANLAGAVLLPARYRRLLPSGDQPGGAREAAIVLVDDIVTTGASLASAAATLRREGTPVLAAALVAATPRRTTSSARAEPQAVDRCGC